VISYELSTESIVVTFSDGSSYLYNSLRPGQQHVNRMAQLAQLGSGLNSYINRVVKKKYAKKMHG